MRECGRHFEPRTLCLVASDLSPEAAAHFLPERGFAYSDARSTRPVCRCRWNSGLSLEGEAGRSGCASLNIPPGGGPLLSWSAMMPGLSLRLEEILAPIGVESF